MSVKLGLVGMLGLGMAGCASTGVLGRGEPDLSGFTRRAAHSVLVGDARLVDAKVNPIAPVHAQMEAGGLTLRFGRPGHAAAVARLDSESLRLVSLEERRGRDITGVPSQDAARVVLDDGRFIVCWKRGNAEDGYRALAQVYRGDGMPIGAPMAISPPDLDVMGSPQMTTTDGHHVVATFAAGSQGSFQLFAVPIEESSDATREAMTATR